PDGRAALHRHQGLRLAVHEIEPAVVKTRSMLWAGVAVPGTLAVVAALVTFYDLHTSVSFGDEWIYRWSTTYLVSGHGLHLWPGVGPPALVQIAAASLLQLTNPAPNLLRLTQLPFLALQVLFAWRIARDLG